jgi:hypothetical protein
MQNGAQKARGRRKRLFELKLMNAQTHRTTTVSHPPGDRIDDWKITKRSDAGHNPETQFIRTEQNHALWSRRGAP